MDSPCSLLIRKDHLYSILSQEIKRFCGFRKGVRETRRGTREDITCQILARLGICSPGKTLKWCLVSCFCILYKQALSKPLYILYMQMLIISQPHNTSVSVNTIYDLSDKTCVGIILFEPENKRLNVSLIQEQRCLSVSMSHFCKTRV